MKKYFFEKKGIYALFLFLSNFALANHSDPQWLKLLRYNKTIFGAKSEVDYPDYFLSKKGKTSPKKELEASVLAFNSTAIPADINQHAVCRFPGRYLYLYKKDLVNFFDLKKCHDYQEFLRKLNLESASIIFSSYYINKPASAFGHTFIKLNQTTGVNSDLHSYGVDFSAQVTTKNPLIYGLKGIFGGFYGRFSLLPYFLKLREYSDLESRDLWEFELNLEKEELELLAAHLWDMNLALFDYYYFTENCSYHVFRFLDAIKPEWKLWSETYSYLVPMDTIIPLVEKKGVLKNTYLRKSIQRRVKEKFRKLNAADIKFVKESISKKKIQPYKHLGAPEKTFDALIQAIDYKFPRDIHLGKSDAKIPVFKMSVLKERSQLKKTEEKAIKEEKKFDYGHRSRHFRVNYLNSTTINGIELENRVSLHNTLELKGDAYSDFTLEMGKLSVVYDTDNEKIYFDRFTFANVEALRPFTYLEKLISWKFAIGMKRDERLFERVSPFFNLGIGATFNFNKLLFTVLGQTYFNEIGKESSIKEELAGVNAFFTRNHGRLAFKLGFEHLRNLSDFEDDLNQYYFNLNYNLNGWSLFTESSRRFDIDTFKVGMKYYY